MQVEGRILGEEALASVGSVIPLLNFGLAAGESGVLLKKVSRYNVIQQQVSRHNNQGMSDNREEKIIWIAS